MVGPLLRRSACVPAVAWTTALGASSARLRAGRGRRPPASGTPLPGAYGYAPPRPPPPPVRRVSHCVRQGTTLTGRELLFSSTWLSQRMK